MYKGRAGNRPPRKRDYLLIILLFTLFVNNGYGIDNKIKLQKCNGGIVRFLKYKLRFTSIVEKPKAK